MGTARYHGGRRIVFLDGIRGVAAMMVVFDHFLGLHTQHGTGPGARAGSWALFSDRWLSPGRIGVVAFFLVSGYVIPLSLDRQTLRTFWIRRFFRLYPVYWFAVLVYCAVSWRTLSGHVSLPQGAINAAMIQGGIGVASILPPGWTLGIEMVFYAQSAAATARGLLHRALACGWFWLGIFLLLSLGSQLIGHDLHPTPALLLFSAALGHSLYLRDDRGSRAWRPLFAAGLAAVPVGAWLGQGLTPAAEWGWQPFSYAVSWLVGVGLFVALYAFREHDLGRVLTWFGAISYSVYLIHPSVFVIVADIWGRTSYRTLFFGLCAVPALAWVLYVCLERPSIRSGRRWSGRARTALAEAETQAAP